MMSQVQIENGNFARIHNEISEQLARTDLSGSEFRCLWFLLRKTYGFQKKEDDISYSQFAEGTGLDRRNVIRSLDKMVKRGIIYRQENGNNRPQTWGFNKYFEQWNPTGGQNDTSCSGEIDTSSHQTSGQNCTTSGQNDTSTSGQNDTKTSGQNDTHKRYKDIYKDKTKDNSPPSTSTGDPLMDVAARKWQFGQKGVRSSGWQAEMNLELDPAERVPLANRLAEIWKMTDSIDAGNDNANRKCHEVAVRLHRQGVRDVATLNIHYQAYLADDWRKRNYPNPKPEKLEEFINKSKPDGAILPTTSVGVTGNLGFSLATI